MPADIDGVLTWGLAVVILFSLAGVGYFALTPQAMTDPYTELYVLGSEGNASDYPTELTVNQSGEVTVGVTNQEHDTETYTVVLQLANETVDTRTLTLEDENTWRGEFTFSPDSNGRKDLRILLFLGDASDTSGEPYRELWLQIDVSQ
jgi:uncharacterized membrane protein